MRRMSVLLLSLILVAGCGSHVPTNAELDGIQKRLMDAGFIVESVRGVPDATIPGYFTVKFKSEGFQYDGEGSIRGDDGYPTGSLGLKIIRSTNQHWGVVDKMQYDPKNRHLRAFRIGDDHPDRDRVDALLSPVELEQARQQFERARLAIFPPKS